MKRVYLSNSSQNSDTVDDNYSAMSVISTTKSTTNQTDLPTYESVITPRPDSYLPTYETLNMVPPYTATTNTSQNESRAATRKQKQNNETAVNAAQVV